MYKAIISLILAVGALVYCSSCSKRGFVGDNASVNFNTDTLTFDTVFTAVGSVTKQVLIYNKNSKWLKVTNMSLAKGATSQFRINVDGKPGNSASNLEIAPFDSAYIFVAVTVDPTAVDLPFIIEDDLVAQYGTKNTKVHLMAYGQNAVFVNDSVMQGNLTWTNTKPYVVVNSCLIDSSASLTIMPGTKIYMHNNSKFFVKGTLKAIGTKTDSIIWQGDRLDRDYFGGDGSGEWCGLHFLSKSTNNELTHCTIKNGGSPWKFFNEVARQFEFAAPGLIYLEPHDQTTVAPKLTMNNCYVGMSISYGVLAYASSLRATNCLFHTCGANNFAAVQGGKYNFTHCTFANYGYYLSNGLAIVKHDNESILLMTNALRDGDGNIVAATNLDAKYINCIVYGTQKDGEEVLIDKTNAALHNISFEHCILAASDTLDTLAQCSLDVFTKSLINNDPSFENTSKLDYNIKAGSSAKGAGIAIGIAFDIEEFSRSVSNPSVGAFE
jgi:hypothetical protein